MLRLSVFEILEPPALKKTFIELKHLVCVFVLVFVFVCHCHQLTKTKSNISLCVKHLLTNLAAVYSTQ